MFQRNYCFWCSTSIDKKGNFVIVQCMDHDDCGNYDYFCSDRCIDEMSFKTTIDFTKCNCCEGKITRLYDKNKNKI